MSRRLSNVRMIVGDVSGESEGSEDSGKQPVVRTSKGNNWIGNFVWFWKLSKKFPKHHVLHASDSLYWLIQESSGRRIPKPKQHYSAEDYMNEAEMGPSVVETSKMLPK